jgi:hypothetical protein
MLKRKIAMADKWLDRNSYRRIHANAKKLGANRVDTKHLSHCAYWKNFKVYFSFNPFRCMIAATHTNAIDCNEIDVLRSELDNVQKFASYLKEFNENVVEGNVE